MNDSDFYYKIARNLFMVAQTKSVSGLKYYAQNFTRIVNIAIERPGFFFDRSLQIITKKPKRVIDILIRRKYPLQEWEKNQKKLNNEYHGWIEEVEKSNLNISKQEEDAVKLKKNPLISLITPVFNPPVGAHTELIESVLNQTYKNFELLLYNFGDKQEVEELLNVYATKDTRIKVKHGLPNAGISGNSNLCLRDATGEFVGLLDHDDALTPDALFECVKAINETNADFVYSDKDKITESGIRFEPFFKPGWSPELELGGNYLTHFNLMRTEVIRDIGGWDPETDGAQDWDLFWRIIEKTGKVAHVPKIIYHWRTVEGSTANEIGAKPYVKTAQQNAINKHLRFLGIEGEPYHEWDGQMYVDWPQRSKKTLIVIHALHNNIANIEKLINRIRNETDFNDSSKFLLFCTNKDLNKFYKKHFKNISKLSVIIYEKGTFVSALTDVLKSENAENVLYISDSIDKIDKVAGKTPWLSQLLGWLDQNELGIAGGLAQYRDSRVIDCGSFFDNTLCQFDKYYFGTGFRSGYIGYLQWIRNFVLVSERIFVFRRSLIHKIINDRELAIDKIRDDEFPKLLALTNLSDGLRAVYDPSVTATDSAPFNIVLKMSDELEKYLHRECSDLVSNGDPYYNPGLNFKFSDPKPVFSKDEYKTNQKSDYKIMVFEDFMAN